MNHSSKNFQRIIDYQIGPIHYQIVGIDYISNFSLNFRFPTLIGTHGMSELSNSLLELSASIPSEFARKPRSLREVDRWKATEFRQFLLYTGPVVLAQNLNKEVYDNFMLLFCGITILICPKLSQVYSDYAIRILASYFYQLTSYKIN